MQNARKFQVAGAIVGLASWAISIISGLISSKEVEAIVDAKLDERLEETYEETE